MASNLSLFPTLTENLAERIGIQEFETQFFYHEDGNEYRLSLDAIDGLDCFKLSDERGLWNFDEYDLVLKKQIVIENADHLFGKDGVACHDAELGVAIEWMSPSSRQRGTVTSNETLRLSCGPTTLNIELPFEKALLRGQVSFRFVLFMKTIGHPSVEECHLANQYGLILGEIKGFELSLDGSGSEFPIYNISDPGQPLWYVKCDWSDPAMDAFNDCVSIYINEANPSYKYLDVKGKTYDMHLIVEVVAHALTVVIMKLKENPDHWRSVENADIAQQGSVASAINYMLTTFENIDFSNVESISLSMRKYLEKRMNYVV